MSRRFTLTQLSRILSEHSAGNLCPGGISGWGRGWGAPMGCINQAAYNEPDITKALKLNEAGQWFDENYRMGVSAEELLHGIEAL